jgi:transcriptional regulator with XRE-family HTH domain
MTDEKVAELMRRIRQRREQLNYSQEYVAGQLHLTQKGYSKLELNKTKLCLEEFLRLCEVLETSPEDLLTDNTQF